MASKPATSKFDTIILEDVGDCVRLLIGKEKQAVMVSRTVLMLLSPVFRKMVSGPFREGTPENQEIALPDDDLTACLLLFAIGHLHFAKLPLTITFKELFQLAVLCDKYDTVSKVRPFFKKWAAPYYGLIEKPGYEEWMHIAWIFGSEELYSKATNFLVRNIAVDADGIFCDGRAIEDILHLGSADMLVSARKAKMAEWARLIDDLFDELSTRRTCATYKVGYLTTHLWIQLAYMPKLGEFTSLLDFAIITIKDACEQIYDNWHCDGHCTDRVCRNVATRLWQFINVSFVAPITLPEKVIKHLETQALK